MTTSSYSHIAPVDPALIEKFRTDRPHSSQPTFQTCVGVLRAHAVICQPNSVLPTCYGEAEARAYLSGTTQTVPTIINEQEYYFHRLVVAGIVSRLLADSALVLWRTLRAIVPGLPVPAESAHDSGPVHMHWRAGRHELSIEIPADEPASWVYRDRQTGAFEGNDFPVQSVPAQLVERLKLFTATLP